MLWIVAPGSCPGATLKLLNGQSLIGEPIAPDDRGIIIKVNESTLSERIGWTNFTETALKELAKDDKIKPFVEPYLFDEDLTEEEEKIRQQITPRKVDALDRPDPRAGWGALSASPVSIACLLVLYLANLYAAWEIGIFRNYQPAMVAGVSAVLPVFGPILFLCLPTNIRGTEEEEEELVVDEAALAEAAQVEAEAAAQTAHQTAAQPAAPAGPPPPTIYQRGQFTFNRRFFETKFAPFTRIPPGEDTQDMVLCVESARGNYIAQRIAKIQPNELCLLVAKGGATSEVVIPFGEIKEIQIRHKDA